MEETTFEAVVVGAGPAGLAAGLSLANLGLRSAVVGPLSDPADGRTAALFEGSIELLRQVGAWDVLANCVEPLRAIRLVDATGGLLRAPEVTFWANEIGREAFGFNVPTGALSAALEATTHARLQRIVSTGVCEILTRNADVCLRTAEGQELTARLVVGADGRNGLSRTAAGIATTAWAYPQAAVVATFAHSRPHDGVSTELHRRSGPLTVVPMPGRSSSLVWVDTPQEAERLAGLGEAAFAAELSQHLSGLLGTVHDISPRRVFKLSGQTAATMAANRIALIGETAHVIPPIGAQGLNLSLRDAATLAEVCAQAKSNGADPGSDAVLTTYARQRSLDITARVWTIDIMNRSLLSEYLPVHVARGAGLLALKAFAPLRHLVMREGMTPSFATPSLMRRPSGVTAP